MSESENVDDLAFPGPVPAYQVPVNVPFMFDDFQPVHIIPDLMEEDMEILLNIPGMRARIGLNETSLTRALGRGDFALAERIIEETTDPEFLNDGALAATPLNIVLSGRSSFFHQPRNLKLALLLLQRGANPNLRIPNHDMESASEAPLELLLRYYLRLMEVFGGPGHCRTSYRPSSMEETELMDTVGLHGELGGLGPMQMVAQTRQLLIHCLENGGDTNLPTTDAAKTIYHMAVTATVPDKHLVIRMLELGANVNSADLHNTTPLMDVVMLGSQERCCEELDSLLHQGKTLLLDSQNCSLQSVLWRARFQGQMQFSRRLLVAGASGGCSARVERVTGRPMVTQDLPSTVNLTSGVPPLLAPTLNDSPCSSQLHANFPKHKNGRVTPEYSLLAAMHCVRTHLSPLVDSGSMCSSDTAAQVGRLIRSHTNHSVAADDKIVDPVSRVQLMYGQITAGLRQLCVRAILQHTLFTNKPASETLNMMEDLLKKTGVIKMRVEPSATKMSGTAMYYEYELSNSSQCESSASESEKETPRLNTTSDGRMSLTNPHPQPTYTSLPQPELSHPTGEIITLGNHTPFREPTPEVTQDNVTDYGDEIHQILRDCDEWEEEVQGTFDMQQRELRIDSGSRRLRLLRERLREEERQIREEERLIREDERRLHEVTRTTEILSEEVKRQHNILTESELIMGQVSEALVDSLDQTVPDVSSQIDSLEEEVVLHPSEIEGLETQKGVAEGERRRTKIDENWSLGSLGELELIGVCDKPGNMEESANEICDTSSQSQRSSLPGDRGMNIAIGLGEADVEEFNYAGALNDAINLSRRKLSTEFDSLPRVSPLGVRRMPDLVASSDTEEWDSPFSNPPSPPNLPLTLSAMAWDHTVGLNSTSAGAEGGQNMAARRQSVDNLLVNFKLSDNSTANLTLTSDSDQESTQSSDTWGGTFSLSCTKKHREGAKDLLLGDATIVSKLTSRTLSALADRMSIPASLRPCFSVEAARMQVSLLLFNHQSIGCDRNCEGDESDSDSEDDWLATDTDHVSDSDTGGRDSDSSDSHFSLRSWFGSTQDGSEGPESSLARADSNSSTDHSWLPDTEEMYRTRQFLSQPAPQFHHSTDSDTESNNGSEEPV